MLENQRWFGAVHYQRLQYMRQLENNPPTQQSFPFTRLPFDYSLPFGFYTQQQLSFVEPPPFQVYRMHQLLVRLIRSPSN